MNHSVSSRLRSLAHACTGFGSYMMSLHGRCLDRRSNGSCEGGPTADEAKRDYRRMHTVSSSYYPFGV